jgi:ribosome-interacting GTPase 1
MVKIICQEYKKFNLEIVVREDATAEDIIDAIEGNRKYVDALFVYNKCDTISIEDIDELARRPNSLPISVNSELNLDFMLQMIWERLNLCRVYTKKRGMYPDFEDPIILTQKRKGVSIESVCQSIHKVIFYPLRINRILLWISSMRWSGVAARNSAHRVVG